MLHRMGLLALFISCPALFLSASEEMLVIDQNYNIVENVKDGINAKDVRQVLYVTRDFVCIDEYGKGGDAPTETFQIDLKNQRIVNLDHGNKQILLNETFTDRRTRIDQKKQEVKDDLGRLAPGPQRNKVAKMYEGMLDDERGYSTIIDPAKKSVSGVDCNVTRIVNAKDATYIGLEAALHPEIDLPYDNAEVLFLLKIIGGNLSKYLKENKTALRKVPMEMHLTLAAGGKLDTKVTSVKKTVVEAFDPKARALGNPFEIPADYAKPKPRLMPALPVEKPKERAD